MKGIYEPKCVLVQFKSRVYYSKRISVSKSLYKSYHENSVEFLDINGISGLFMWEGGKIQFSTIFEKGNSLLSDSLKQYR